MDHYSTLATSQEALLNSQEAAKFLGCTESALALWRRERRGPTYLRISRLVRYRREDLLAFLKSCAVCADAQR
jgi:predicted DNA-binding transcriptional regulator AlpA